MKNAGRIAAIVQARTRSSRLPDKVLRQIKGREVILHDLDRIKHIPSLHEIIIATTTSESDDILPSMISTEYPEIKIFRGEEEDVLDRYYNAAKQFNIDTIVRITSDCPLIDPRISEMTIKTFIESDCDYCSNRLIRTFPIGLDTEVFSFHALESAWKNAKENYQREHVTPYIYEHPLDFKLLNIKNEQNLGTLRWTLDTPEDLEFIKSIYDRLYDNGIFYTEDILSLLRQEPTLADVNKQVRHKHYTESAIVK
jgi:spore coat polysaccharide biosynthesis protein SpsF